MHVSCSSKGLPSWMYSIYSFDWFLWTLISGGKHGEFMPRYWVWPACYVVWFFPYNNILLSPVHISRYSHMYVDSSSSVRTFTLCQHRFYLMYSSQLSYDLGITIIPILQMRKQRPREVRLPHQEHKACKRPWNPYLPNSTAHMLNPPLCWAHSRMCTCFSWAETGCCDLCFPYLWLEILT